MKRRPDSAPAHPVGGSALEIARRMKEGELIRPGAHNMLVYGGLGSLSFIYSEYAKEYLPKNEIILLATQYEPVERVVSNLLDAGVNVSRYAANKQLFIIDAQKGYFAEDVTDTFRLARSLTIRARREGRRGFTWLGDMGSFFALDKIEKMMHYELSCPTTYEDLTKTVCCYHSYDFKRLDDDQREKLLRHHVSSMVVDP